SARPLGPALGDLPHPATGAELKNDHQTDLANAIRAELRRMLCLVYAQRPCTRSAGADHSVRAPRLDRPRGFHERTRARNHADHGRLSLARYDLRTSALRRNSGGPMAAAGGSSSSIPSHSFAVGWT